MTIARRRGQLALFLLLLAGCVAEAATLGQRIEKILNQPGARRAFWGVKVLDLDSGRTLYQLNADRFFVPASNTKLFSTALALLRLGPDYRFLTRLAADAPPDADGHIPGNLVLIGGGDPNFSSRVLPYEKQTEFLTNRLAPLEELADQVAAAGVRQIDGDVVGDDTFFVWQRYQQGWAVEDTFNGDGPPVTALAINDNTVTLRIRPGQNAGDPALVTMDPATGYFTMENRIRTASAGSPARAIRLYREPGEQIVRLAGEIAVDDKGRSEILAIDNPALFAAQALREALVRRSVTVLGRAVSRHAYPWDHADLARGHAAERPQGWVLASLCSMPLLEGLRVINKVSQNLHAEIALRTVAHSRRGIGSMEASLAEMKDFLKELGVGQQELFLRDGSGLSRMNLVTPGAIVGLLAHMWNSPHRAQWVETLPVAGLDGSLRGRFLETAAVGHLRGKTGSLSHVRALSGYISSPGGRHMAFSVMVNNHQGDSSAVRGIIDRVCLEFLQSSF